MFVILPVFKHVFLASSVWLILMLHLPLGLAAVMDKLYFLPDQTHPETS